MDDFVATERALRFSFEQAADVVAVTRDQCDGALRSAYEPLAEECPL